MMDEDNITWRLNEKKREQNKGQNWGQKMMWNGTWRGWDKGTERDWKKILVELIGKNFLGRPGPKLGYSASNEWMKEKHWYRHLI